MPHCLYHFGRQSEVRTVLGLAGVQGSRFVFDLLPTNQSNNSAAPRPCAGQRPVYLLLDD
jgi:hypothetical protein